MNKKQKKALELANILYRASTALREYAHDDTPEKAKTAFNALIETSIPVASEFLLALQEQAKKE